MAPALQNIQNWLSNDLRRPAVLISMIFSVWVIQTNDTINVDGILYIDAAWQIMQGNWQGAKDLYTHLFYPFLIASIAWVLPIELETAANLINTILFAGLSWFFLSILMEMNAPRRALAIGLFLISIHPYINDYRADIIRGPGFWMFFLAYIYFSLRFFNTSNTYFFALSLCCLIIMTLFRTEGIVYLILSPLVLLSTKCYRHYEGYVFIIKSYAVIAGGVTAIAIAINTLTIIPFDSRLGQPIQYWGSKSEELFLYFSQLATQLETHVLPIESSKHSEVGVIALMLTLIITTIIKRSTLLLLIISLWSLTSRKIRRTIPHYVFLISLISINFITLIYHSAERFYLSSRFAMPTALIIAIIACYGIVHFFEIKKTNSIKILRGITIFTLFIMAIDGLYSFGASKYYLRETGNWMKDNLSHSQSMISNHLVVDHYAGKRHSFETRRNTLIFSNELMRDTINWSLIDEHNYLAVRLKHLSESTISLLKKRYGNDMKYFPSAKEQKSIIFKIH